MLRLRNRLLHQIYGVDVYRLVYTSTSVAMSVTSKDRQRHLLPLELWVARVRVVSASDFHSSISEVVLTDAPLPPQIPFFAFPLPLQNDLE